MTLEEFEQQYAERSGMTVEQLYTHGLLPVPCDCEEPGCNGWRMTHMVEIEIEDASAGTS